MCRIACVDSRIRHVGSDPVSLGMLFNLPEFQFPHVKNRNNLIGLLWRFNKLFKPKPRNLSFLSNSFFLLFIKLQTSSSSSLSRFNKGYPIHLLIQVNNLDVILDSSLFPTVLPTFPTPIQSTNLSALPPRSVFMNLPTSLHLMLSDTTVSNWATAAASASTHTPYSLFPTLQPKWAFRNENPMWL